MTLEVGDERVHLRHHGAGHTGRDTVVRFERANVIRGTWFSIGPIR